MIEKSWNFARTVSYNNQSFNDFLSYKDKGHRMTGRNIWRFKDRPLTFHQNQ